MRKVLCSIGVGPHAELLAASREGFSDYADRHGYELSLHTEVEMDERPPAWAKIKLLQQLLPHFDLVLWMDADAGFVDPSIDIATAIRRRDLMGLVAHRTKESSQPIPNCGVWLLRSHSSTCRLLDEVWASTEYVKHKWWENAAVLECLGYQLHPEVRLVAPTRLFRRTRLLSNEWNSIPVDSASHPRIVHFPGAPQGERLAGLLKANEQRRRCAPLD